MARTSTYTPGSASHRALTVLADGDCRAAELPLLVYTHKPQSSRRKRMHFLIDQLAAEGLIERRDAGWLTLTELGRDVLDDLRAGLTWYGDAPVLAPGHVRVFRRAA